MARKPTYEEIEQRVENLEIESEKLRQAQEALRDSENKFRSITENAVDYIFIKDNDRRYTFVNKAMNDLLGLTGEGILGKTPEEVFGPQQARIVKEVDDRAFAGEIVNEIRSLIINDKQFFFNTIQTPLSTKNGEVTSVMGIVRDVTQREAAEEALRRARDELEQNVEKRTRELKGANKELQVRRQKLQALASELCIAEERERRRIATMVHDNIGQSLAYAKMKLNQLSQLTSRELSGEVAEIVQLIDVAIGDTRSLVSEIGTPILYELGFLPAVEWLAKKVRQEQGLDVKIEDDGQPKPLSDDARAFLFHAVRELLANIVKHAHATCCTVSLAVKDGNIEVDVVDDGNGFDPLKIQTGFAEEQGFGFFSIRERIGPLGGRLGVYSKPNKGTRITLVIPLA
jgi:PAS domain S-box-containing protein